MKKGRRTEQFACREGVVAKNFRRREDGRHYCVFALFILSPPGGKKKVVACLDYSFFGPRQLRTEKEKL